MIPPKIDYKSPVQGWKHFAEDWKSHGVRHALRCIKAGLLNQQLPGDSNSNVNPYYKINKSGDGVEPQN